MQMKLRCTAYSCCIGNFSFAIQPVNCHCLVLVMVSLEHSRRASGALMMLCRDADVVSSSRRPHALFSSLPSVPTLLPKKCCYFFLIETEI